MAKLTKQERKNHGQACALLQKDVLTLDDKIFVLENWHEGANHENGERGAFFTPSGLARDFGIDAGGGGDVIDLCAGIGGLMFWLKLDGRIPGRMVCVEINPAYIAVGRKILPDAEWIQADVFDQLADLGKFALAISNPPFGAVRRSGNAPRYSGRKFEYHVMDIAADLAETGAFIVPQTSAPFIYSGGGHYREKRDAEFAKFAADTGIVMTAGCGIDTAFYKNEWHGVAPICEVACIDFDQARRDRPAPQIAVSAQITRVPAVQGFRATRAQVPIWALLRAGVAAGPLSVATFRRRPGRDRVATMRHGPRSGRVVHSRRGAPAAGPETSISEGGRL